MASTTSPSTRKSQLRRSAVDELYMREALAVASDAASAGDVPVGAVIICGEAVIARASNRTLRDQDATAHAEVLAIRAASAALGSWHLGNCTLYVTLEPCAMCAGALVLARLQRVVFGAWDDRAGMAGSVADILRHPRLNHRPQVTGGVLGEECGRMLRDFFAVRRRGADASRPAEAR